MKIISASRRTDIPAFHSRWLLGRLRAGFCHWLNPFGGQIYRVSLRPKDVLAIVFWTRNPRPLLAHLPWLRDQGYAFYFHFTLNGYPREVERHNPPLDGAIETFARTTELTSPDLTHWRYDPILLSDRTPPEYHWEQFDAISRRLEGLTRRCYFSFTDFYSKTERNMAKVERAWGTTFIRQPSLDEQRRLVHGLRDIAAPRGITLYACCEGSLVGDGVAPSKCIDDDTIAALRPDAWRRMARAPTRADCGCVETADIGAYDTCGFGCSYCYATNSGEAARRRMKEHDPEDSIIWRPTALRDVDLVQREFTPRVDRTSRSRRAASTTDALPLLPASGPTRHSPSPRPVPAEPGRAPSPDGDGPRPGRARG
jgi:hypothetical protein